MARREVLIVPFVLSLRRRTPFQKGGGMAQVLTTDKDFQNVDNGMSTPGTDSEYYPWFRRKVRKVAFGHLMKLTVCQKRG